MLSLQRWLFVLLVGIIFSSNTPQPSRQPSSIPTSIPTSPSGQPTSSPTGPTPRPTRRPTRVPTSQPSSLPSSQPSSQPTNPTSVPSSSPTYDFRIFPVINERYRSVNATYFCHRRHLHSTPNPYRRMFDGLSLDSLVFIKQMVVTLIPFDATYDALSLKVESNRIGNLLITTPGVETVALEGQVAGRLTLNNPGIIASRASDWNYILNQVVYRLDLDRMPPSACDTF
eukprot:gene17895-20724_t